MRKSPARLALNPFFGLFRGGGYPKLRFRLPVIPHHQGPTERSLFLEHVPGRFPYFWCVRCSLIQRGNREGIREPLFFPIFPHFISILDIFLDVLLLFTEYCFTENCTNRGNYKYRRDSLFYLIFHI